MFKHQLPYSAHTRACTGMRGGPGSPLLTSVLSDAELERVLAKVRNVWLRQAQIELLFDESALAFEDASIEQQRRYQDEVIARFPTNTTSGAFAVCVRRS